MISECCGAAMVNKNWCPCCDRWCREVQPAGTWRVVHFLDEYVLSAKVRSESKAASASEFLNRQVLVQAQLASLTKERDELREAVQNALDCLDARNPEALLHNLRAALSRQTEGK